MRQLVSIHRPLGCHRSLRVPSLSAHPKLCGSIPRSAVHLINEGLELEEFLQQVGPFKDTVYKTAKDEI